MGAIPPLRTTQYPSHRKISLTQRSSTPWISQSGLSVTCRTRLHLSASLSPGPSPAPFPAAPVASIPPVDQIYDTVRLGSSHEKVRSNGKVSGLQYRL